MVGGRTNTRRAVQIEELEEDREINQNPPLQRPAVRQRSQPPRAAPQLSPEAQAVQVRLTKLGK